MFEVLNDPIKHSELRQLIHQERMVFFGLVETRVRDRNKDNVSATSSVKLVLLV